MQMDFSIVVPVFNEEESLRELLANVKRAFAKSKKNYEIIFVDDGSTDRSLEILKLLERENSVVKTYSFRRNLGKSQALMLGFKVASGKFIVTLDADLQDDPSAIFPLFQKLTRSSLDLVSGRRKQRRDNFFKRLSSTIFNAVVSALFKVKLYDLNSGLKIYRAEVAKDLKIYGGMHRFIPVIAHEAGYKVAEKDILHHKRKYGVSKYKLTKMFTDMPDLATFYFITKYNRRPFHFFGKIGVFVFGVGAAILLYLSYLRLFLDQRIGERPLLIFGALLVLAGLQIIFTGLLADLIVNLASKKDDNLEVKYKSGK